MEPVLFKQLAGLVHLDVDAWHAYGHAIRAVDLELVKHQLTMFQQDHERHAREWCEAIASLGGEAPPISRDLTGWVLEGFTALRSATGGEGALKAIRLNEVHTNARYEDQHWIHLPPQLRELLQRCQHDEHRHLQYVEQAIEVRVWEDDRESARGLVLPVQTRLAL